MYGILCLALCIVELYALQAGHVEGMSTNLGDQTSKAQNGQTDDETADSLDVLEDLRDRAQNVLSELEQLKVRLRSIRQEASVEVAHFRGAVQSELSMLERLINNPDNKAASHIARSSNLPFLETVWKNVKASRDVVALQKRVYFDLPGGKPEVAHAKGNGGNGKISGKQKRLKACSTVVDAMTDGGLSWTKVSLVTNTRLLFDLAKQGWESGGSSGEDDEPFPDDRSDDDRDIPLLKTAKELSNAARSMRIRTRHPKVTLILPRIVPGAQDEIDKVIGDCEAAGVTVRCGEEMPLSPEISEAIPLMAPDPFDSFSKTLNIDCTILLAVVSEFSHAKVSKEPWFHTALQRQVEIEDNENLLPSLLYPAMIDHRLVCTKEAAKRMREIVDTIGTLSEKARTAILMGDGGKSQAELIAEMQQWSAYKVPDEWLLPIEIVDQNDKDCQSSLPPEAAHVIREHTAINKSVFLYGWASGHTTITSNRTVVKQIENELDKYEDLDDRIWPSIWLCPTARSLVGKEKRGAKRKEEREKGAWPLPDPLRREEQRRNGLDVLSLREGHEVADLRPDGYDYSDVIAAKNASKR